MHDWWNECVLRRLNLYIAHLLLGATEKRSLRSANEIVQVGHDNGPSPTAEFLSQRRLGLLPKRQCLAQSRPSFPGNFDGATAAPALVAHPDQTLSFKRSQVSGQG